ncbi:hypothetical protein [Sphingomonas cavernae]|uniref:Uncharacterized protein n=1 Tax=Sphingomonas cavernae TaxID=2320861 RepID=A0A418WPB4_9SPHN|nr:hypothetical protein [Sphingomonas cavernae]RJF93065.1 hypothetical protein D3876_01425 [Sphingomonas cavernae]
MARKDGPPISEDMLFEALLKQGCSAEKAARIAHAHEPLPDRDENVPGMSGIIACRAAAKEDMVDALRKG